jgi:predicted SAM-dependent methyltransferase
MRTEQLYDINEEQWRTKLHVGCGGIYLRGYENIDTRGEYAHALPGDFVDSNSVDIREYYKTDGEWNSLPERGRIIVDKKMVMQNITYEYSHGSIDKIVAIQSMEHLDPIDFVSTLDGFFNALRKPGVLIVSVPDIIGTLDWMDDARKVQFAIRHLRGSMKDDWSRHNSWWTIETLAKAFEWVGFDSVTPIENFHSYPSIVMKGRRVD